MRSAILGRGTAPRRTGQLLLCGGPRVKHRAPGPTPRSDCPFSLSAARCRSPSSPPRLPASCPSRRRRVSRSATGVPRRGSPRFHADTVVSGRAAPGPAHFLVHHCTVLRAPRLDTLRESSHAGRSPARPVPRAALFRCHDATRRLTRVDDGHLRCSLREAARGGPRSPTVHRKQGIGPGGPTQAAISFSAPKRARSRGFRHRQSRNHPPGQVLAFHTASAVR